jgi:hypothetical protein
MLEDDGVWHTRALALLCGTIVHRRQCGAEEWLLGAQRRWEGGIARRQKGTSSHRQGYMEDKEAVVAHVG